MTGRLPPYHYMWHCISTQNTLIDAWHNAPLYIEARSHLSFLSSASFWWLWPVWCDHCLVWPLRVHDPLIQCNWPSGPWGMHCPTGSSSWVHWRIDLQYEPFVLCLLGITVALRSGAVGQCGSVPGGGIFHEGPSQSVSAVSRVF